MTAGRQLRHWLAVLGLGLAIGLGLWLLYLAAGALP